jgi:hypothetical protein
MICLFIFPVNGAGLPLEWLLASQSFRLFLFWLFLPSALPAADWMLLASLGPLLEASVHGFEWKTFPQQLRLESACGLVLGQARPREGWK